ncbi:conserved hypothetical protein [Pseudomonas sp. 8Z]|uniref:hypothetical protein n=1 Tax=Pseudomonas sp. 8Z TaxID=2653166 RepID=UPI0012F01E95|nr:hypothetical protein [Pseudomonas sp. 8Z]VXC04330.1 conserved hypothetical protein [Pseudomonas sp. 8Z]
MSLRLDKQMLERIYRHGVSDHSSAIRWSSTLMTFGLTFMGLFQLNGGKELLLSLVVSVFVGGLIYWMNGSKDPLRSGDPLIELRRNGMYLRVLCDNQVIWEEKLLRKQIASVASYQQQGWLFSRDRGLVIEDNEGKQWRLALKLSKAELDQYSQTLHATLEALGYSLGKLRRFQP